MGKKIFWIFVLVVVSAATSLILYIQSESFARLAKGHLQERVVSSLGLEVQFDRIQLGVFPPSISLVNLDARVISISNPMGLSTDTIFKAGRFGLTFRMIQAFSRGIVINKFFLSNGDISILVPESRSNKNKETLWGELVHQSLNFQITPNLNIEIKQIEVRDTKATVYWREADRFSKVYVNQIQYLSLDPSKGGTSLVSNLETIDIDSVNFKEQLKVFKGNFLLRKNLVQIDSLDIERKNAVVHLGGRFVGDLNKSNEMKPELDMVIRGPLKEVADYFPSLKNLEGDISGDFKISGKLKEPIVHGKAEIQRFAFSEWHFEKFSLAGSYGPGIFKLDSLKATEKGGSVSLKSPTEVNLPLGATTIGVSLSLQKAKLQDFMGTLKDDLNNLRLEADGEVALKIQLGEKDKKMKVNEVAIVPNVEIRDLELNNQTWGKNRPYKKIFKLATFKADANAVWREGDIFLSSSNLRFETGNLSAQGRLGRHGYDINGATEHCDFGKEVGEIGGSKVAGQGSATIKVEGDSKNIFIKFGLKQKGAKFSDFDIGDVEGEVVYDDARSYVLLNGLKAKKNSSPFTIDGKANVGEGDDIALDVSFWDNDPNDVFAVFAKQTEKITWLPRGMIGVLKGKAKVRGGYSDGLNGLLVDADINGKNLSYKGEFFHEAQVKAGVKRGTLYAKDLKAKKYDSVITGEIEYDRNDVMEYSLQAEKGKLRSLDFITSNGLPMDGMVKLISSGKGKWETLESSTRIELRNAFVRTRSIPSIDFTVDTYSTFLRMILKVGSDAEINVKKFYGDRGDSSALVKLNNSDFTYLLCLLNRRVCNDNALGMRVDGDAKFSWIGDHWRNLSGAGILREFEIARTGYSLKNPTPVDIKASDGKMETERFFLEGLDSKLSLNLKGRIDGSVIDNRVKGNLSLKVLEFVTSLIEEGKGNLSVDLGLNGSIEKSAFSGFLSFQDGFLRMGGLDAPAENINGRIGFKENRANIETLNGQMGGGAAQVTGGFNLYLNQPPKFELDIFATNNRIKFYPINYAEFSEAKLSFTGDAPPYQFNGNAKVRKVMMRDNFDTSQKQDTVKNAKYLPDKVSGAKAFYEVKIRAVADGGIFVQNDLLDAEYKGEATLLNNFEYPQIVAKAELVKGKLKFGYTTFTLEHAYIRAPNPELFNPQYSLGGMANIDNYRVTIFIAGTANTKPKITFSSVPGLPQEDLISLVTFGLKGDDTKRINASGTSAITYSEVGSIVLDQLRINQNLQQSGLRMKVVPSVDDNEANLVRPNSPGNNVSPKVYLQTTIARNLEATLGGTVGATQGQKIDGNLEYRLGKRTSVSAVYEQSGAGLDTTERKTSYGGDLKIRWGFK